MMITKKSPITGNMNTREIDMTYDQYIEWLQGPTLIQDCLSHLSADDREFLISGLVPGEWEELFGPEETENLPELFGEEDE